MLAFARYFACLAGLLDGARWFACWRARARSLWRAPSQKATRSAARSLLRAREFRLTRHPLTRRVLRTVTLLQELAKDNIEGCTTYSVQDTHSLVCDDFTMAPG